MSVVLNLDVRIFLLDVGDELSKDVGAAYACHILEGDLVSSVFHQLVNYAHIILYGMYGRVGDGKGCL